MCLFELGHIFVKKDDKYVEQNKIAAVVSEKNSLKPAQGLFRLKGIIHILFEKLGIDDVWFDDEISEKSEWLEFVHSARRVEVKSQDKLIGWVGELRPEITSAAEIKEKVSAFELNFDVLTELASEERAYRPPSKYPAIARDLAVVVEKETKVESVLNVIETAGGGLLQDTDLFDIYEGLPNSKKSLAFRLIFQSDEKNLTDKEVNGLMEKIIKAAEEKGWEIRKKLKVKS